jgi:hypothetical protein
MVKMINTILINSRQRLVLFLQVSMMALAFLPGATIHAQSLDKIGSKHPLKISGGLSVNQVLYFSSDSVKSRNPYTWIMTGNINFNLYGWNAPFSYTISNYNKSFQQPFNQYSIHPNYKWVRLHIGNCSMSFSPYTLSGHTFLGVGVELTPPGMFRFSAMYGRLNKAIAPDTSNSNVTPYYKRMGYGFKTGITKNKNTVEFILFKARDDVRSLNPLVADTSLTPKENLILGASGKTMLIDKLSLTADYACSYYTSNLNTGLQDSSSGNIYAVSGLMKIRQSTSFHQAVKASMAYSFQKSSIGVGYERVDPGYASLGAYYSSNDFVNYTANASTSFWENKMTLSLNTGLQHDDLDDKKSSITNRFVNAVNIGYNVNQKLNLSGSYSNFSTVTNIRSQFETINQLTAYDNLDTLNYTQLSQSANLNVSYALKSDQSKRQNMNLNLNYMVAKDKQNSKVSGSDFLNANLSYSHSDVPNNLTITGSFNSSYNRIPSVTEALTLGPSVSASKQLLHKTLRNTLSLSKNNSYANGKISNSSFISRLSESYTLHKKHNFSLSLVYSFKKSYSTDNAKGINDFTATLNYTYGF